LGDVLDLFVEGAMGSEIPEWKPRADRYHEAFLRDLIYSLPLLDIELCIRGLTSPSSDSIKIPKAILSKALAIPVGVQTFVVPA
jgi:hypothetical protein